MRVTRTLDEPLRDEHVLAADPPLAPVADTWRRRINAFPGRALGHRALSAEQAVNAGVQRLRGRSVAAGVIEGLEAAPEVSALGAAPPEAWLRLAAGSGLARSGEDLRLPADRRIALGSLPIWARADLLDAIAAGDPAPAPPAPGAPDPAFPGLRPLLPRRMGPALAEALAAPAAEALPRAAVLVLEPTTVAILADAARDCPPDPRDDPYDDLQLIDGARLALAFWPAEMLAGDGGADYGPVPAGALKRNALAHRVFAMERRLGPRGAHPWEGLGLPLALVGFAPDWTLEFVDRAAVRRMGGAPIPRTQVAEGQGSATLWQAQVAQFAEHLADLPELTAEAFAAAFRTLPPVGGLPRDAIDVATRRRSLFPATARISLRPAPLEEVGLAVDESAPLAPLRLDRAETVELLAPVPAAVYEPRLFEIEAVDPAFAAAIRRIERDRAHWLARREYVRARRERLAAAIAGKTPGWDEAASPPEEMATAAGPLAGVRIRRVAAGPEEQGHLYRDAPRTERLSAGDRLFAWVRVGAAGDQAALGVALRAYNHEGALGWGWGDPEGLFFTAQTPGFRAGALPPQGVWTRIEAPFSVLGAARNFDLDHVVVGGLAFRQSAGTAVEWGPVGTISPSGRIAYWLRDATPFGAVEEWVDGNEAWEWTDLPPVSGEEGFGVEAGTVQEIEALIGRWPQGYLADEFAVLREQGLDAFLDLMKSRIDRTNDRVDLGFVRARADIYRLRRFMLGGDAAAKLVTSPALADLATREEGARATSENLSAFLKAAYVASPERDPDDPLSRLPVADDPVIGVTAGATAGATGGTPTAGRMALASGTSLSALSAGGLTGFGSRSDFTFAGDFSFADRELFVRESTVSLAGLEANFAAYDFGTDDVLDQRPMPGTVERTATVAERLETAPAVEAQEYASAGKIEALGVVGALIGGGAAREGVALGDLEAPGWVAADGEGTPSLAEVLESPTAFRDRDAVAGRHEASYFAAGAASIDSTVSLLRLIEGRVAIYRRVLGDAGAVRKTVRAMVGRADARLREIDVEVAEARHDAAVAAALLAEETARVAAVNARRAAVIDRHVEGFVFRRPRRAPLVREVPVAAVSPAATRVRDLVCPPDDGEAPEEIRDYVALLAETPAGWWKVGAAEIARLDRLQAAREALALVQARAALPMAAARAGGLAAQETPGGWAVKRSLAARRSAAEARRASAAGIDRAAAAKLDLAAARATLLARAALADLAQSALRRAALARRVAEEVERVGDAAACLHAGFAQAAPAVRLAWAQALSAFDDPAPMADLSTLPDWGRLPLELRRALQDVVDWLYARLVPGEAAARAAMDDLVRICALTASLAPAGALVPARLVSAAPARPGATLLLSVDVSRVRAGMTAVMRDAGGIEIVRATVMDLSDGAARAQVVRVARGAPASLAAGGRVELMAEGAR
ncbi:hypothetical protein P2H44_22900 [Albimonas sp. CAU 1670]|uniref:hypothetical protein n=1 Tax=Albimonas sp. CAU 1670 TaxID=3032599 RepID=UPI0023DA94DB|nr:hypothetical protein [Albimonas sp. CAU 1670]MDF2235414.1 hypothetical protein [Albimonas sp. CAU 1670]